MTAPVPRLRRLTAALAASADPDAAWLADALARYLTAAADGLTLDAALGLATRPGREPWWATELRQRRDELLRLLWRRHWPDLDAWSAAGQIAEAARRYEASAWRFDRRLASPPGSYAGQPKELLWHALQAGNGRLPGRRRIADIIAMPSGRSFL